ncbi:hypothetical protein EVAR_48328_1 [Eumeta japonica]|uniref:Uncharacterized protein n=1 Tax=Eumeta variegata TaxID=151549 RepID=A0A4C1YS82_EUMVA|nr:hypothetical protein EVAR_48328_1 [Eumeta japonica]
MRSVRNIRGVPLKDKCRNSDVRERCGLKEDVVTKVKKYEYKKNIPTCIAPSEHSHSQQIKSRRRNGEVGRRSIITFPLTTSAAHMPRGSRGPGQRRASGDLLDST